MKKLKIYNTLAKKKEVFKPLDKNGKLVKMYSCGPTVYWYQHIGNMRYAVFVDLLKRGLIYDGYNVKHVMNITDVGHLTSDADEGEDKMVKAIKREGLDLNKESMLKIAKKYTAAFLSDLKKLNVKMPDVMPRATEHINEMIDVTKKIEKNGYAYKTDVGLIFDTSKFKDYRKLAKLKINEMKFGKRVKVDEQRKNKTDFALWITNQPNHIMQWDSPWGRGFPGWHIECSAMSSKYLGEQFDIHTGGEEHVNVHHTNEIAQSEAAFNVKPWVKYWLHLRWLLVKGEKMSKSKGSTYLISDLEEKGFSPLAFRYLMLLTHYRKHLSFDFNSLKQAQDALNRAKKIISEIKDDKKTNKKYSDEFEKAINNDLDMPSAVSVLWKLLRDKKAEGKINTINKMDEVFGLDLLKKEEIKIPFEIKKLADERQKARKNKEWKKADKLRNKINSLGWKIEDIGDDYRLEKLWG
jgi:cysteinyl-tRNA synthetase